MCQTLKDLTFSLEDLDPSINYKWTKRHNYANIDVKYFIDYTRELGHGHNTIVRKVVERETGNRFAVKSVKKSDNEQFRAAQEEASILARLDHSHIVKNYATYEDEKYFYMITDICKGGEVFNGVETMAKRGKHFPEHKAASIIQQLLQAVTYCHNNNLVHRDIKLENIMLQSKKKDDTQIKLIDFGLSTNYDPKNDEPMTSAVGSPHYVAPEVLNGSYSNSCDVWSIGVSTYALLTGTFPFKSKDEICSKDVEYPSEVWDGISDVAKCFVRSLLQKDTSLRPSAIEAANHEWFQVIKVPDSHKMESFFKNVRMSLAMKVKGQVHPQW